MNSDFKRTLFYNWFYRELSFCFGHIAHFDADGFYATWFGDDRRKLSFLSNVCTSEKYGHPEYTHADVEKALARWVKDNDLIGPLMIKIDAATEAAERAELARLSAKYN